METLDNGTQEGQRSTFLTVLCILTFIGSGLGLLGSLLGMIGSSALGMFSPQGTMLIQVFGLIAAALCLYGAIQMWGLKKQGFMIYVAGAAVSVIGGIVGGLTLGSVSEQLSTIEGLDYDATASAAANSLVSGAIWTGVAFGVIINVAFVLMYNANKKQLVK